VNSDSSFVPFEGAAIEQSIPERFEQQVVQHAHRLAVKGGSEVLTYDQVNQAANRLARAILTACGEGEEPIAWLFGHETSTIVAILGILKAGKICVPLEPSLPRGRIAQVLDDSQARLIVTNDRYLPLGQMLSAGGASSTISQALSIEQIDRSLSAENLGLDVPPANQAYIFYTSGSTGRPKGVIHTHRSLLHRIRSDTNGYRISVDDRLSLLTPMSFGASKTAILGALLNGAAVFPFDLRIMGLNRLARWLMEEEITIVRSAATVFRHFVATLTGAEEFPSLRLVKLGGEPIHRRDVELFRRYFSEDAILRVGLASTETDTICWNFIDKDSQIDGTVVPVGRPLEDKEVLLLNEEGELVDLGQVGEIAVRSRYLASGYWRQPDLTRSRFLSDPEDTDRSTFLTGDLGRWRPDGLLEHLGRKDLLVKVRGYRIELSEIEVALLEQSNVKEAVAAAQKDTSGIQHLIAYVVPADGRPISSPGLRGALAERLPEYMLPMAFVELEKLPLTSTGKVDRLALPRPDPFTQNPDDGIAAPRDSLELELVGMWQVVLRTEPIGVRDDFFELGGDSLLAGRLLAAVERRYGQSLAPAILFQHPTVEQLAGILRQDGGAASWAPLVMIQPGNPQRLPLFLVHGMGGSVVGYADLARHLGPDQPVYGLQARGLDGLGEPHHRMEDMAAFNIEAMQSLQPSGPYHLAGYCFGGIVAFEMAQQLEAKGQRVGLLVIMDVPPPASPFRRIAWNPDAVINLFTALPVWAKHQVLPGTLDLFRSGSGKVESRLEGAHKQASRSYVPQVYPGRITLFRARSLPLRWSFHSDPLMGWGALASAGVEVTMLPGYHSNIHLQPHVQFMAKELRACLDKAQPPEPAIEV
jgi:amino acid adenylation domain-containing protein